MFCPFFAGERLTGGGGACRGGETDLCTELLDLTGEGPCEDGRCSFVAMRSVELGLGRDDCCDENCEALSVPTVVCAFRGDAPGDCCFCCTLPFVTEGGGRGLLGEVCGDGRIGGGGFAGIDDVDLKCPGGGGADLLPYCLTWEDIAGQFWIRVFTITIIGLSGPGRS